MELERGWQKFRGGPFKGGDDRLHVTLNERGMILMNARVYRLMNNPAAVQLYYNRDEDKVAIEPTDFRLPDAYPVRNLSAGYRIHASSFCRHFNIRFATTHKMINPEITDERRLILDLQNTTPVFRRRDIKRIEAEIRRSPPQTHFRF